MKRRALIIGLLMGIATIGIGSNVWGATSNAGVNLNATIDSTTTSGCQGDNCGGGTTPPQMSVADLAATAACSEATVSWYGTLDGVATSTTGTLTYWPQNDPGSLVTVQIPLAVNHLDALSSLLPQTIYEYRLTAQARSFSASGAPAQFTTTCVVPAPALSVAAANQKITATVTYPNFSDIAGIIFYRGTVSSCPSTNPVALDSRTAKQASTTEVLVTENPGTPGTDYGYSACIYTSTGLYSSAVYGHASRVVPDVSSAAAANASNAAVINWANPANDAEHDFQRAATRVVRATTDCAATTLANGVLVSEGTGTQVTDAGLQSGQNYQYKLFTKNSYGEYSPGVCVGVSIPTPPAQCIAQFSAQGGDGQIELSWRNPTSNQDFTFQGVEWHRDTKCLTGTSGGTVIYSGVDQNYLDAAPDAGLNYYTGLVRYNNNQVANCGCVTAAPNEIKQPEDLCPDCAPSSAPVDATFYTHNESFKLPLAGNTLTLPVDYQLSIVIDRTQIPKPVRVVAAHFNDQTYLLSYDAATGQYHTTTMTPAVPGSYPIELSLIFEDDTIATANWQLAAIPWGRVTGTDGVLVPAQVMLYDRDGRLVMQSGMPNPFKTTDGRYVFVVPNGDYVLEASSDGYVTQRESVTVTNTVINRELSLQPPAGIILESAAALLPVVSKALAAPVVKQTTVPVTAASLGVTALSTALAVPWWNFLTWIQSLFTEPLLWLSRRRRKGWGTVYNSITKQAIDLAVVRLFDAGTKRLMNSKITDRDGRYTFLVDAGTYYLEVVKPGFQFPSKLLKNATEDQQYHDLYYGGPITITEGNRGAIIVNIPLDPNGQELTDAQIFRRHRNQRWHRRFAYLGPLLAIIAFAFNPGWLTGAFLIAHVAIFGVFYRLGRTLQPKSWGVVYDRVSHKPLAKAVARIFSPEYNRMLEAYVTDRYGRYGFIAGGNQYYVTADKDGYATSRTGIVTIKPKTQAPLVSYDIGLSKGQGGVIANSLPAQSGESPVPKSTDKDGSVPVNESVPVVGAVREPSASPTANEPVPVTGVSISDLAPAEPLPVAEPVTPVAAPADQPPTTPAPIATHSAELPKEDQFG